MIHPFEQILYMTAPQNCLQYMTDSSGSIWSFNWRERTTPESGYMNNLDYSICFKKLPGFCTISFTVPNYNDQTLFDSVLGPVLAQPTSGSGLMIDQGMYFRIKPNTGFMDDQAGAGPYDCPSDYLILAGERLCGYRLNPALLPQTPNSNVNTEVVGE